MPYDKGDNLKRHTLSSWRSSNKPHLLIYAHYYYPDTASTGQIVQDLAEGMVDAFRITVICVVPSYLGTIEDKWKVQRYYHEDLNGVDVLRVSVPEFTKTNKISRVKNIMAYFFRAMRATGKIGRIDYVMSISQPPVLGGLLGAWGRWSGKRHNRNRIEFSDGVSAEGRETKNPKYIYHIQDCNPEQIIAVGYFKRKPLLCLLKKLDTYSCSKADFIVVPARDMVQTIEKRFAKCPEKMPGIRIINNWTDDKEIYPLTSEHPKVVEFKKKYGLEKKYIISYSGNLGQYYDLDNLLKVIRKFKGAKTKSGREVVFVFIGNGTQKVSMEAYVQENHMDNVVFIPYQEKKDLIYSLNAADVQWCVNAKGIKGVSCPSKYYGIAAVGKPVLGVLEEETEIRCVIEKCGSGLCCEPGDYKGIERNLRWFIEHAGEEVVKNMGLNGRKYLEENLSKERSIGEFRNLMEL